MTQDSRITLREANQDRRAGRYHESLEKLCLLLESKAGASTPPQNSCRSFILSSWLKLAQKYPHASERLQMVRDMALQYVKAGEDIIEPFKDFAAINERLGDHALTCEVFNSLQKEYPKAAVEVYQFAESALIAQKDYATCMHYANPEAVANFITDQHQRLWSDCQSISHRGKMAAERRLLRSAATIVALMSVAKQTKRATELAARFSSLFNNSRANSLMQLAMQGVFPSRFSIPASYNIEQVRGDDQKG